MAQKYKELEQSGLFGEEYRLAQLSEKGDPLERLNRVIAWEMFLPILRQTENTDKKSKAGARPYNPVLMFKIVILQRYYNLSDEQIEYQILDRLSFCRFLGLSLNSRVPDAKTIWDFKERLTTKSLEKELFDLFHSKLEENALIVHKGKIVDASFVEMPKQRNTKEENAHIKQTGTAPASWSDEPHKQRQKDTDARWGKKGKEWHFGYKDHIKIDNKHKFIDTFTVTDSSVHDSQVLDELLVEETDANEDLHADSAYTGEEQEKTMEKYKVTNQVHEKGTRDHPLTEEQKASNREKSKTRARVEHVFGFMEGSMGRLSLNCIGLKRATATIGLINLTYNLFRYEQLVRLQGITMSNC